MHPPSTYSFHHEKPADNLLNVAKGSGMSKNSRDTSLSEAHAKTLPLIFTTMLCIQILATLRVPIIVGWDLPLWLILSDLILILINVGLLLWIGTKPTSKKLNYPLTTFAYLCAGFKVITSVIVQGDPIPFYLAVLMLTGSLCFLSVRYLVFSMALVLLSWVAVALLVLSHAQIASTMLVALLGAGFSIFVQHWRILAELQVFELKQRVETLEAILPMCVSCKRTQDHTGKWQSIEDYLEDQEAGTQVSHSSCPSCTKELFSDYVRDQKADGAAPTS